MHIIRADVEVIDSDCKRCRGIEIETVKEGKNGKVIHRCKHINKCLVEEERVKKKDKAYHNKRFEMRFNYAELQKVRDLKRALDVKDTSLMVRFCIDLAWNLYAGPNMAIRFDRKKAKETIQKMKFR